MKQNIRNNIYIFIICSKNLGLPLFLHKTKSKHSVCILFSIKVNTFGTIHSTHSCDITIVFRTDPCKKSTIYTCKQKSNYSRNTSILVRHPSIFILIWITLPWGNMWQSLLAPFKNLFPHLQLTLFVTKSLVGHRPIIEL